MTQTDCPTPTKTLFTSQRQAKRALKALKNPQGRMHAYRCGGHWHLGHRLPADRPEFKSSNRRTR